MKKLLTFLLAAIAFVACTQNEVEELTANRADVPETLTVGFEGGDTRVELNEALKTVWTEGDEVSVFYRSYENMKWAFQGATGDRSGELKRVSGEVGDNTMDNTIVVYPYNESYKINLSEGGVEASLPAVQSYKDGSYGKEGNIMVAAGEFTQFTLKSVCGWLRVELTGEGEIVESITVRGNDGEQLAGLCYIDAADASATLASNKATSDEDGEIAGNINFDGSMLTEVVLNCGDGVELGAEATEFYVALLPQALAEGFTVAIYCTNGTMMTKDYTNSVEIKRNHIHPISAFKYNGMEGEEPEIPEDDVLTFNHRILLIDHTGVNCGNCPRVMDGLAALAETEVHNHYNEVCVHGGAYASSGMDKAYSDAATVVDKFYGVYGYPDIRFNFYDGEGSISSVSQFVAQNTEYINSLVKRDGADAGIAVSAELYYTDIYVDIDVKAAVEQEYKVTAWLLENNIYNPQQSGASKESHKIHNHALRNIGGTYSADDLSGEYLGKMLRGEEKSYNFNIGVLGSSWETANMEVLVIVSAKNSDGLFEVVNTALCPVNTWVDYYDNRGTIAGAK